MSSLVSSGRIYKSQSGWINLRLLALISMIAGICVMAFVRDFTSEMLGGLLAGGIALLVVFLWNKFCLFKVYFISPVGTPTAEGMKRYAGVVTDVGECTVRFVLRPRKGIILDSIHCAFFNKKFPFGVGKRRYTSEVKVTNIRFYDKEFREWSCDIGDESTDTGDHAVPCSTGSAAYFELDISVSEHLKGWSGRLSIRFDFERDGNPDNHKIPTPFWVKPLGKRQSVLKSKFQRMFECETRTTM